MQVRLLSSNRIRYAKKGCTPNAPFEECIRQILRKPMLFEIDTLTWCLILSFTEKACSLESNKLLNGWMHSVHNRHVFLITAIQSKVVKMSPKLNCYMLPQKRKPVCYSCEDPSIVPISRQQIQLLCGYLAHLQYVPIGVTGRHLPAGKEVVLSCRSPRDLQASGMINNQDLPEYIACPYLRHPGRNTSDACILCQIWRAVTHKAAHPLQVHHTSAVNDANGLPGEQSNVVFVQESM